MFPVEDTGCARRESSDSSKSSLYKVFTYKNEIVLSGFSKLAQIIVFDTLGHTLSNKNQLVAPWLFRVNRKFYGD